jgi:hypothetical protein
MRRSQFVDCRNLYQLHTVTSLTLLRADFYNFLERYKGFIGLQWRLMRSIFMSRDEMADLTTTNAHSEVCA